MSTPAETAGDVRRVVVPAAARELSTLPRIDYEDAHLAGTPRAQELTAERWARSILEEAPGSTRTALRSGWASLGLQLGSTGDPGLVLGWEVRRSDPDFALLAPAGGRLGLLGEVLVMREPDAVLVATFLQLKNPAARAIWAGVAPGHRQVVRRVLEQGVRRAERAR
jgi:hypothetical protein